MEFLAPLADELRTLRRRPLYPVELLAHIGDLAFTAPWPAGADRSYILPAFSPPVNPKSAGGVPCRAFSIGDTLWGEGLCLLPFFWNPQASGEPGGTEPAPCNQALNRTYPPPGKCPGAGFLGFHKVPLDFSRLSGYTVFRLSRVFPRPAPVAGRSEGLAPQNGATRGVPQRHQPV